MKRLPLSLSIISLLLFPILSCEEEKVVDDEKKQEQEKEKEPEENDEKSLTVTADAFNITIVSADLSGYANLAPSSSNVKIGILYSTDENPTADNGVELIAQELDSKNKYTVTAKGLYPETTYYYCSFVIQGGIRFKGTVKSFTTKGLGVNLRTGEISNLTCYSAKVSGNISFDEGVKYTNYTYGICYDTIQEPTVDDKKIQAVSIDSEGNYTCQLRALSGSTKYYYRLYATVDSFIKYSVVDSLLTVADSSVVTTGNIDLTTYEIKSKIEIGNGVYNNLLLGVCYGINEVPTVNDRTVNTNEVDDASNFVVKLERLSSGIPYYYRAYVVIDSIPHYGEIKSFIKERQIGEAVDLGLSVKWGSFNVGADYPEDYGEYYAWGELETKTTYNCLSYKYRTSGDSWQTIKLSKYNTDSSRGTVDNKTTLELEDDVAHVIWGDDWRMPTKAELQELRNNCTWTWTEINGVSGFIITSNKPGYTNNSIFLPAAGSFEETEVKYLNSRCEYNSSSLYTNRTCDIYIIESSQNSFSFNGRGRFEGRPVRPVCQSETWLNNLSITINKESLPLLIQRTQTLSVTVKNEGENVDYLVNDTIKWTSDNPSVATVDNNGLVTALSVGTANIKVTCYDKSATCIVTVTEPVYEYVDLGLSVNWATFNVGAMLPEEYGNHYAWGETEPKTNYDWPTYKYSNGSAYSLTKYCVNVSNGNVDSKTTLDIDDDVAYVKWGGNWRMPTKEEFQELSDNCTWEWTTINDVYGFKVTSNKSGFTGNSIFLPAAGYHHKSGYYNSGSNGYYNSSSLNTSNNENQHEFLISDGVHKISAGGCREHGHSVRPVSLSETWLNNLSLTLNKESISLIVEREQTLSANVSNGGENVDYLVKDKIAWSSDNPSVATVDNNGLVTALSVGTANIKVTCYDKAATCIVTVTEPVYEYVDLGLSVNWATFNVGAMIPEEYGNYYSWGEIVTKSNYNWSTYKYSNGASNSLTKYCSNSSYGSVDGKTVLDLEDDVAFVKWGGNWRMPTIEEATELISNCTWSSTIQNGVYGYLVYSKIDGYTDKSIFLPAAGGYHHDNGLQGKNLCGYYWVNSNSINPIYANGFSFDSRNGSFETNSNDAIRVDGRSVRPVCKSDTWYNNLSISINQESASIEINESKTLSAIIKNGNEDVTYILKNQLGWSSDKPSVATVDKNGIIKGISEGTAEISVSYNDMTATCQVTVTKVEGEWVLITESFSKSVPFRKIRVLNKKSSYYTYCCVLFSASPNDNLSESSYFVNFDVLKVVEGSTSINDGIYITNCTSVGDNWYEYEFNTDVYFANFQTNTPKYQVKAYIPGGYSAYEYVDLGLSVKWATCNIGASSPEGYGDYYAWGETEIKTNYSASTYKFRTSGNSDTNIKCSKYNVLESGGVIDNKVLLESVDDVAHVLWGGKWRMPTKSEQEELINNCSSEWTSMNGVQGIMFTSKKEGYTNKSIFLPAAGYYSSSIRGHESGKRLLYWSSILDTSKNGHCYYINSDPQQNISLEVVGGIRYYGKSIRPVCP